MDKETFNSLNIPHNFNLGMDGIFKDSLDTFSNITDDDIQVFFEESPKSTSYVTTNESSNPSSVTDKDIKIF